MHPFFTSNPCGFDGEKLSNSHNNGPYNLPKHLIWWAHLASNQGPSGYEPVALPTELWALTFLIKNVILLNFISEVNIEQQKKTFQNKNTQISPAGLSTLNLAWLGAHLGPLDHPPSPFL